MRAAAARHAALPERALSSAARAVCAGAPVAKVHELVEDMKESAEREKKRQRKASLLFFCSGGEVTRLWPACHLGDEECH